MESGERSKKLIAIVGPTAVGKTAVAIELAERLKTEIISADSRQIFTELAIGTAKPSKEELLRVTHHFINIKSITEPYDAGQYGREAFELTAKLFERYDTLVLCGGSGLYIRSLLEGFDKMPDVPLGLRDRIVDEYRSKGLEWLQVELEKVDPEYFKEVDVKNPQRLMRALELNWSSGQTMGELRKRETKQLPFQVIKVGLELPREELYQRIDSRMDQMVENGLFAEAEKFYPQRELNALQTVGYQEIFDFMEGMYDRIEAIRLLKRNSRRYAKRQLTWFKKDKDILWIRPEEMVFQFIN
jgi:tRNA dimethylallyltransferase